MSALWEFIKAVWKRWRTGLTGGALVALLVVFQATGHSVSAWFYGVIVVATLCRAFFLVWRDELRKRKVAETALLSSGEKDLLKSCRNLKAQFMELMRRFPSSPSLANPFGKTWRPLVGTTTIEDDVRETMKWQSECQSFLEKLEKHLVSKDFEALRIVHMIQDPMCYIGPLAWPIGLDQIESLLLGKVLS